MFEDNEINSLSPDLIYENGVCVKASDCPCEHHGMLYPSGLVIQEDCNNWSDTKWSSAVVELRSIDACVCVNACIDFVLVSAHVLGACGTALRTAAQVFIFFYLLFLYLRNGVL